MQRAALEQLQAHIELAFELDQVVDLDYVLMAQLVDEFCLLARQLLLELIILFVLKHFDRHDFI